VDKPFDNRALANTFGIAATLAGAAGAFIPVSTSAIISRAFPDAFAALWFLGLMLCGIAVLLGSQLRSYAGTKLVGVGLGVGACFLTSYGILLLVGAGWPSFTAATFVLTFAVTCFLRANRIRILIRDVETALLSKGG
jgi:hypothetical protein